TAPSSGTSDNFAVSWRATSSTTTPTDPTVPLHHRAPNQTNAVRPAERIERHTVCGGLINEYRP
ncbi:MAG: hypothetical protein M3431_11280, partial [Actinomycetota bacterium]|nr:hypothetical protein [Actinomycetota bacterium]